MEDKCEAVVSRAIGLHVFGLSTSTISDHPFTSKGALGVDVLTQIPKLSGEFEENHAAFSIGGSNFGEVGGGQCNKLSKSGFRCE
jgi:hypothetical protein